jgi:hypothetical protein
VRLLCFNQRKQPVLTDFRGKIIPPYAILSHRWGNAEILLEDIGSGTYKEKMSVGTVWRHEKVERIVIVFRCLRGESNYNVGASLYRLAAGRWDER